MTTENQWQEAQLWERLWWIDNPWFHECEKMKGRYIANLLLIDRKSLEGKSILDIGCGPFSLLFNVLQQSEHPGRRVALDPNEYGDLDLHYSESEIKRVYLRGEDIPIDWDFDEVWIYNVLQHVEDPIRILNNATRIAKKVRMFEWVGIAKDTGHIHTLSDRMLDSQFITSDWNLTLRLTGTFDLECKFNTKEGHAYIAIWEKKK